MNSSLNILAAISLFNQYVNSHFKIFTSFSLFSHASSSGLLNVYHDIIFLLLTFHSTIPLQREFYYRKFLKSILKHAVAHLQPSDIEDISVGVSALQAARESEIQAARSAAANIKTRADDYGSDFM